MQVFFCKRTPKYMQDFAFHAMEDLGITSLRGELRIQIVRRVEGDCYGQCYGNDREVDIQVATRMMHEPISRENKLLTIAHELVHARQCLRRELVRTKEGNEWHGADISYLESSVPANLSHGMPWETEAFGLQQGVVDRWYTPQV